MSKTRLNISTDQDLADFIKTFALENRTTVAEIFTQYILALKRKVDGETTQDLFASPHFNDAMAEAQAKLQDGSAIWHSYNDVFGD